AQSDHAASTAPARTAAPLRPRAWPRGCPSSFYRMTRRPSAPRSASHMWLDVSAAPLGTADVMVLVREAGASATGPGARVSTHRAAPSAHRCPVAAAVPDCALGWPL